MRLWYPPFLLHHTVPLLTNISSPPHTHTRTSPPNPSLLCRCSWSSTAVTPPRFSPPGLTHTSRTSKPRLPPPQRPSTPPPSPPLTSPGPSSTSGRWRTYPGSSSSGRPRPCSLTIGRVWPRWSVACSVPILPGGWATP